MLAPFSGLMSGALTSLVGICANPDRARSRLLAATAPAPRRSESRRVKNGIDLVLPVVELLSRADPRAELRRPATLPETATARNERRSHAWTARRGRRLLGGTGAGRAEASSLPGGERER